MEAVCVKTEPACEDTPGPGPSRPPAARVLEKEAESVGEEGMKEEPSWPESSVSEAAALADLYAGHVVKDELVLGPERPHRPTVGLVASGRVLLGEADGGFDATQLTCGCFVRLERLPSDAAAHDQRRAAEAFDSALGRALGDPDGVFAAAQLEWGCFVKLERLPSDATAEACESTRETSKPLMRDCRVLVTRVDAAPRALGDQTAPTRPTPHTHSGTNAYVCDTCSKSFQHKYSIIRHIQSHLRKCEPSPNNSPSKNRVNKKEYACKMCLKRFEHKSHWQVHERVHTGERPYTCEICFKRFTQSGTLKTHYRIHSGDKPFSCEICRKRFTAKGQLNRHRRLHPGEKPYSCRLCESKFSDSSSLWRHKRFHVGNKSYICNVCKKAFTQAGHLHRHIRTHTGERPYSCKVCNKTFPSTSSLNSHERVHTELKPYSCEICGKDFKILKYLKLHLRLHTKEKPHLPNQFMSRGMN